MEAAQRAIQGGIGGLQTLVADQQQIAQAGVDRGNEANVQKFLDRLQGARTPEEVLALQQTGELDTLRSVLTPKDLARVRGAEETRAASLMQQLTAKSTFETQQAAAKAAPIKDQILSMYMTGDPAQQARAKELFVANPNIPGGAELVKSMNDFDQVKATRDFQAQLNPLKLQAERQNLESSKSNAAYQEEQRQMLADERAAKAIQAKLDAETKNLRDNNNIYADGVLQAGDSQELSDALMKAGVKDPGERTDIIKAIFENATYTTEGTDAKGNRIKQTVPLPKKVAMDAAMSAYNGWFSTAGGSAKDAIKKLMSEVREYELDGGGKAKLSKAAVDFRNYEDLLQRRQAAPVVVPGKSK
jgi:hypothetical protein